MINRTLVRSKVVQTLFAYYKNDASTPLEARKSLLRAFSDTYSLYLLLLNFANELTSYAESQFEVAKQRAVATHKSYTPNRKFVNSPIAQQLFNNRRLRSLTEEYKLNWNIGLSAVQDIYKNLVQSDFYTDYMSSDKVTYEEDKKLWRNIYTKLLLPNPHIASALEEMEIAQDHQGWTTDLEIVISYVVKTIKQFKPGEDDQPLLEMFDNEKELEFAKQLLQYAIDQADTYRDYINKHLKNWDPDRIAYMDVIILLTALAEIINFPDIAIEVSMNEYIDLAKEYSGDKNYQFINGILTEIVRDLNAQNVLIKIIR